MRPGDYVETRLRLPDERGFWPATWTWNGDGSNEQDTYEFYSDNHYRLYLTNHYGPYAGTGALLLDMFVYAKIPPTVTEESMLVDYVRVHRPTDAVR